MHEEDNHMQAVKKEDQVKSVDKKALKESLVYGKKNYSEALKKLAK